MKYLNIRIEQCRWKACSREPPDHTVLVQVVYCRCASKKYPIKNHDTSLVIFRTIDFNVCYYCIQLLRYSNSFRERSMHITAVVLLSMLYVRRVGRHSIGSQLYSTVLYLILFLNNDDSCTVYDHCVSNKIQTKVMHKDNRHIVSGYSRTYSTTIVYIYNHPLQERV